MTMFLFFVYFYVFWNGASSSKRGEVCHWLTNESVPGNCYWPCSERRFLVPRSKGLMNKYYFLRDLSARLSTLLSHPFLSESESELLYDWRFTADQFVLVTSPLRLKTSNFIFQLNTCGYSPYVTSCLTRGWVCRLQLLLVLARAVILRSEFRRTHDHILLSQIRDSPNLEGQVPVFISTRNSVARLYPQALGSLFVASYDSQGYGGGIRPPLPPHGIYHSHSRLRLP
jgi:hypothetical protein